MVYSRCTPDQVRRYRDRISGPLLDRIDLQVAMPLIRISELQQHNLGESSADIRARVIQARERQLARQGKPNQQLNAQELEEFCYLRTADQTLLVQAIEKLGLSTRAYHRILKVARTLADMKGLAHAETEQVIEALSYRTLDR